MAEPDSDVPSPSGESTFPVGNGSSDRLSIGRDPKHRLFPLVVVAIVAAAYGNSLSGPFVFDDLPSIVENPSIRQLWDFWAVLTPPASALSVVGRPLPNLTLALNYAWGGLSVSGYHVVNVVVHMIASLILYGVVHRTLTLPNIPAALKSDAPFLALIVAALWAAHPLQTESVTYTVQRSEALMGLFYLLTLYCTIRSAVAAGRLSEVAWGASAMLACLCGMASKEVMVSAPAVICLYDCIFLSSTLREVWQKRRWLYTGLAATWIPLGLLVVKSAGRDNSAGFGYGISPWEYFRTQFGWIVHYLFLSFWPHPLVLDYGSAIATSWKEIVPCALFVATLFFGSLVALRYQPWLGLLGIWFFAILAPTSSIVPLFGQTAAERRMYLPLAAVCTGVVVAGWLLIQYIAHPRGKKIGAAAATAAVMALAYCTWQRNQDYQSILRLWESVVRACPQNNRGYVNRGLTRMRLGDSKSALADFDTAIQLGAGSRAFYNRGLIHKSNGDLPAALKDFNTAIERQMRDAQLYFDRGLVHRDLGQLENAIADYSTALQIDPLLASAYNNRGAALQRLNQIPQALADHSRAIELEPNDYRYRFNRGALSMKMGRFPQALQDFSAAIQISPGYAQAYLARAEIHERMNQIDAAIGDYNRALELIPDSGDAIYRRARCHFLMKDYRKAQADVDEYVRRGGRPHADFVKALADVSAH